MNWELVTNVYRNNGNPVVRLIYGNRIEESKNKSFSGIGMYYTNTIFGSEGSADFVIEYRSVPAANRQGRENKKTLNVLVIGAEPGASIFSFRKMWRHLIELAKDHKCSVIVGHTLKNKTLASFYAKRAYANRDGNYYIEI